MGTIALGTKAALIGLNLQEFLRPFSSGIMRGSYILLEGTDPNMTLETAIGEVGVELDVDEGRVAGTTAFASTLFSMSMVWTYSKMAVAKRAAFISSVSLKLFPILEQVGFDLSAIKVAMVRLSKASELSLDAADIGTQLVTIRENLTKLVDDVKILDDTLDVLEFANTLGGEGNYLTPTGQLIGKEKALLNAKEVSEIRSIADSNKFFKRRGDIRRGRVQNPTFANRIFINPQLAQAADMFLPTNAADDLFNIKNELANTRKNLKGFTTTNNVDMIRDMTKNIDIFLDAYMNPNSVSYLKPIPAPVLAMVDDSGKALFNMTASFADDQKAVGSVKEALDAKVGSATRATESWLLRGSTKAVEYSTYAIVRGGSGGVISAARTTTIAQRTAAGFKVGAKGLGRFLFWDTVLWGVTGAYDLVFVDEDKEYDDPINSYLADNAGFSIFNLLIDSIVDFFVPQDVQNEFVEGLQLLLATAASFDSLGDLTSAVVAFYIDEINLTIYPYDIYAPQLLDGNKMLIDGLSPIKSLLEADPTIVLWASLYACVAKLVFKQWVLPSVRYFTRQATGVGA